MSVRDTSIAVYRQIKEEGLLSKRRLQVYEIVFEHGPMTAKQLCRIVYPNSAGNFTGLQARLPELCEMGVLREVGKTTCQYTGREIYLWDVTSKLPIKLEGKATRIEKLKARVRQLEAEVEELKFRLSRSPEKRAAKHIPLETQASLFDEP